jgi:hypothetical protein
MELDVDVEVEVVQEGKGAMALYSRSQNPTRKEGAKMWAAPAQIRSTYHGA